MEKLNIKDFYTDYKWLIIAGVILFLPGMIFFILHPYKVPVCPVNFLCAGHSTLFGAVTSVFLFDSVSNIFVFAGYLVVFWAVNLMLSRNIRQKRDKFAALSMFAAGITANIIDIIIAPGVISYGSSGVVYAFTGIVLGFIILNLFLSPMPLSFSVFTKRKKHKEEFFYFLSNLCLLLIILSFIFLDTGNFLSKAPGINVPVHGISLLLGLIAVVIYGYASKYVFKKSS